MNKKAAERKKKRVSLSTIIAVIILLTGLSVLLYPTVSDYWNSRHQTMAVAKYDETVASMSSEDYEALFAEAEQYNQNLAALPLPFEQYDRLDGDYRNCLDITGEGILGYIAIPKIGVELTIYHGTGEDVLNKAAGHLEGSSLPVGGEGTHAVLSAHRGLPSDRLFTDLDKLEKGDTFTITVLNRVMTYEVDQILIVEPTQMDALSRVRNGDYVTLVTCTPYGVNTHRLLVRGRRVENQETDIVVHPDAMRIPVYIVMPAIMIPIVFVLLIGLLLIYRKQSKPVSTEDIRRMQKERIITEARQTETTEEHNDSDQT